MAVLRLSVNPIETLLSVRTNDAVRGSSDPLRGTKIATVAVDRLRIRQIAPGFYYILCILEDHFFKKITDLMLTKTLDKMSRGAHAYSCIMGNQGKMAGN